MPLWKITVSVYLIGLHFLFGVMLVKSDFLNRLHLYLFDTHLEISTHYQNMVVTHRRMDATVPAQAVIFIGDSITAGLATSAVSAPSVNYGIGADTTLGVLQRLPYYHSIDAASAVVIAIGINDLPRRTNDSILQNYKEILDNLAGRTKIVVSAILPVDERASNHPLANERIAQINAALAKLAKNYPQVVFIDSGQKLQDSNGNLSALAHTGDGIHLSANGYQIWIGELKAALNKINSRTQ